MTPEIIRDAARRKGVSHALDMAISALGNTSDEVVKTLVAAGIRGYPKDCEVCPIARWLIHLGFYQVMVCGDCITVEGVYGECSLSRYSQFVAPMPEALQAFVKLFDGLFEHVREDYDSQYGWEPPSSYPSLSEPEMALYSKVLMSR
jgi:hypothetical protein